MRQHRLGSSRLQVTHMGLGLAALGRPGYINLGRTQDLRDLGQGRSVDALRGRAHEVLDAAWGAGIRYFDVARSYGLAERFLADWLTARAIAPADVVVGSKWGYTYTADWRVGAAVNEVKDHSVDTLRRQLAESRAVLGPWLQLYQIHSATRESSVLTNAAVLTELARARADGLLIGLSVSGPGQADTIRQALEMRPDGVALFGAVQATWNVLEVSAGDALAEAHAEGLGVIVKEALANGRVMTGDPARALTDVGGDATPDAVAIAAALVQPWADIVLSGAVTPAQLRSNVDAMGVELQEDHLAGLAAIREDPDTYWTTRGALAWS